MSTEIRFYHLLRQNMPQALPGLLAKALKTGKHILIQTPDEHTTNTLNDHLWTYDPASFLPHGTANDNHAEQHPITITHDSTINPNAATILILTNGADRDDKTQFDLCCEIFDGNNEAALTHARQKWKNYKDNDDLSLTYWQQTDQGWEKKA